MVGGESQCGLLSLDAAEAEARLGCEGALSGMLG